MPDSTDTTFNPTVDEYTSPFQQGVTPETATPIQLAFMTLALSVFLVTLVLLLRAGIKMVRAEFAVGCADNSADAPRNLVADANLRSTSL